jgi:pimeloyl-ACP methyl ester carboxylesterase
MRRELSTCREMQPYICSVRRGQTFAHAVLWVYRLSAGLKDCPTANTSMALTTRSRKAADGRWSLTFDRRSFLTSLLANFIVIRRKSPFFNLPHPPDITEETMANTLTVPLTSHHYVEVDGVRIFYREAGPADAPVVLLLHGFPTSSFQYRELIPLLADRYRVIAPDLPGFGFTEVPASRGYHYTFDALAKTIFAFTQALKLTRYAMYVFDYGAPTGFRLALMAPERVTAIVSQNGNAYEEGLGDAWQPIQRYWRDPTPEHRNAIRAGLNFEGMRHEYSVGIHDPALIKPESYTLDAALLARPGNVDIQLDLLFDYANNVKLYPRFQEYFRTSKPPLLAIWGEFDPYFIPAGAKAFQRDIPNATVKFLPTGHFALGTHLKEIALAMRDFLK